MLGVPHLNHFKALIFTYDGDSKIKVCAFDHTMVEIPVYPVVGVDGNIKFFRYFYFTFLL